MALLLWRHSTAPTRCGIAFGGSHVIGNKAADNGGARQRPHMAGAVDDEGARLWQSMPTRSPRSAVPAAVRIRRAGSGRGWRGWRRRQGASAQGQPRARPAPVVDEGAGGALQIADADRECGFPGERGNFRKRRGRSASVELLSQVKGGRLIERQAGSAVFARQGCMQGDAAVGTANQMHSAFAAVDADAGARPRLRRRSTRKFCLAK